MRMMNINLRSYTLLWCLLLSCVGRSFSARADETEPATRDVQFVLQDEPYVTKMPANYQPQEDLRYVAIVRGFAPLLISDRGPGGSALDAKGLSTISWLDSSQNGTRLRELMDKGPWHRFQGTLIRGYGRDLLSLDGPHVNDSFVNMVKLLSGARDIPPGSPFWNHFTPAREPQPPLQEYTLLASSVEEAKQFATDFLHAYDQGFVPWLRKFTQEQKAALEKLRDEAEGKAAELDKKIASLAKEVEGVEELGEQAISDLKVKRTLLKVDLAGVEARISAINDKLKKAGPSFNSDLENKLVELKVSADIDHASLGAQRRELDQLIDGQRRIKELARLRFERSEHAKPIRTAAEGLPRCDEILAALKPFQLVDETVVIRPLRFRAE